MAWFVVLFSFCNHQGAFFVKLCDFMSTKYCRNKWDERSISAVLHASLMPFFNAVFVFIEGIATTKGNKFGKRCQSKRAFTIWKAAKSELTRSLILHVPFHASGQQGFATRILLCWPPTCHSPLFCSAYWITVKSSILTTCLPLNQRLLEVVFCAVCFNAPVMGWSENIAQLNKPGWSWRGTRVK